MKKHSKLCAIFLTALLSISAVSFSVSAVGEEVDPGGDSSVIVDPVEPEPEPEPAEPTTADLYARRPRKRKAVVDQLARELEAEDDAAAADAPKGGDE